MGRSAGWIFGTGAIFTTAVMAAGLAAGPAVGQSVLAEERALGAAARTELSLTVYNRDLALVGETRRVELDSGESLLALTDVSPRLQSDSLLLGGAGLRILEQSLQFDLLTPRRILEKSLGETVWIVREHPQTGEETLVEGELLSVAEGAVVRVGERIETSPPGRLAFQSLPEGLRERPTLLARVETEEAGARDLRMRYLTGGLTWRADYQAEISADETRLALAGVVTLVNSSGVDFPDADLRLVAGEVRQAARPMAKQLRGNGIMAMAESSAMAPPDMAPQPLGDLHVYEVERRVSLADRETKQIALLAAMEIPVVKEYRFEGLVQAQGGAEEIGPLQAEVVLEFQNDAEAGGPGRPLPGGVIRVYRAGSEAGGDGGGGAVFIGEDGIGHTPVGEEIRLAIGDAFDVTGRAKRTLLERLSSKTFETGQEIVIKNAKAEAVTVKLVGHLPQGWRMVEESQAHERETANRIVWRLPVPAGGETKLTYRLRVSRP